MIELSKALSGLAEGVSGIFAIVFIERVSRRSYVFSCMTTAGIILITLSVLITRFPLADYVWMKVLDTSRLELEVEK